mmetsp:Transcript_320/g.608  ORF Transcript_320/g.608 Transcript_320/m.608 type:complete len:313 (-) Transcript_320:2092-3030(-)
MMSRNTFAIPFGPSGAIRSLKNAVSCLLRSLEIGGRQNGSSNSNSLPWDRASLPSLKDLETPSSSVEISAWKESWILSRRRPSEKRFQQVPFWIMPLLLASASSFPGGDPTARTEHILPIIHALVWLRVETHAKGRCESKAFKATVSDSIDCMNCNACGITCRTNSVFNLGGITLCPFRGLSVASNTFSSPLLDTVIQPDTGYRISAFSPVFWRMVTREFLRTCATLMLSESLAPRMLRPSLFVTMQTSTPHESKSRSNRKHRKGHSTAQRFPTTELFRMCCAVSAAPLPIRGSVLASVSAVFRSSKHKSFA